MKEFEAKRAELEKAAAEKLAAAQALPRSSKACLVTIARKAGVDGRLFGSVTNTMSLMASRRSVSSREVRHVRMPMGPLKVVGESDAGSCAAHRCAGDHQGAVVGEQ
jgi:large subunit ribosomal protein L9